MPSDQITSPSHLPTQGEYQNYLVLAADLSTCDGETIDGYQLVVASARDEDEALENASAALESLAGCVPLASFTAADLREFADGLCTRQLACGRAFNLSLAMTDTQIAKEDAEYEAYRRANSPSLPADALRASREESAVADPEPF